MLSVCAIYHACGFSLCSFQSDPAAREPELESADTVYFEPMEGLGPDADTLLVREYARKATDLKVLALDSAASSRFPAPSGFPDDCTLAAPRLLRCPDLPCLLRCPGPP